MSEPEPLDHAITGRCLCGSVSIILEGAKPEVEVCHCTMCRQWAGATFGSISAANEIVSGEEHIAHYKSSDWAERAFCKRCGSSLWYCFTPTGHRGFLAGLFPEADRFPLTRQIFCDEQADWMALAARTPMLTGEEMIAEARAAGITFT